MKDDQWLEARAHGDPMFPCNVYRVKEVNGQVIIHCHWHHEMEWIYMEAGEAEFQIGTKMTTVRAGEGLFIPSGHLHGAYPVSDKPFSLYATVVHPDFISSFGYDLIQSRYIDPFKDSERTGPIKLCPTHYWMSDMLTMLQATISQFQQKEEGYELVIKANLLQMMAELVKHFPRTEEQKTGTPQQIRQIKKVLQFIDEHYDEKLTIKQLANLVQMSEGHFSRFFKSIVRMTAVEYIHTQRLNKAARLLRETDRTIMDISMSVGFDHPSYFIKLFKRHKRCTPSEFRRIGLPTFSENMKT
ncbi:AraC family transcriptional regulator [Halalkalibacterium halodurans]|uniref:Transcriptional regulator (AraC/XylS family) n=2 Tax=Halalkalibacterium halodurans TaxID=86665 RepID=Q9KBM0_HALH5|nr:AraC family transcriptional regulator [Halalkalibacterium halodurans]MED3648608.1 AraC family transcriptional regulator [Halalkalibacterium halodurans]MED4082667.1 AraC family transcriptional regulator [Halalkalibacterium halodurans]MED4085867.1 AraC family transcriptional regulator [Halalkalibacterium halodurans]MED4106835.1 AraC family transcriptional regulator [Halalkalibacterium halodurans]MED4109745.1 AraC family transcriptional regulator [Halalkalibacterium halodurans]